MKIVTVAEMIEIEKGSDAAGHGYDAMMELAGRAVAAAVLRHMEPWDSAGGVLVLVGPGNNGGDGLVAARFLRQWEPERSVTVYCWKRKPNKDPNYAAVRRLKIPIVHAEKDPDFEQLGELVAEADAVVDGLLGTGVTRPIGGDLAQLLQAVRDAMARRDEEEALAAEEAGEALDHPPADPHAAAAALQDVQDFDFLRLPPYTSPRLPQVVAIDCPSGLDCDSGQLDPAALAADLTVTFANPKVGHFTGDGPAGCGHLQVADIGTDPELGAGVAVQLATAHLAHGLLPARPPDAHKGTFGKAMIVAGSVNYTGAAYLAATAAYRVGAGLVTLGVVPSLHRVLAAQATETTWLLLPEAMGVINPEAAKVLHEGLQGYAALLVGPGLTQEKEAVRFVHRLLNLEAAPKRSAGFLAGQPAPGEADHSAPQDEEGRDEADSGAPTTGFLARRRSQASATPASLPADLPLVLDADALNALAEVEDWPGRLSVSAILTPHPGEMARLCGCTAREVQADRLGLARQKAQEWRQVILLKGAYSVVAAPDGQAAVLPFANPGLATAGSGDVLAGAIVGALSQGLPLFEAAVLGGYLHGLAGELVRQKIGDAGLVAGDLLPRLPEAIHRLRSA